MPEPGNVFEEQPSNETTPSPVPSNLDDWVGEGKKFGTVEDLVKSYAHSQSHIEKIERSYKDLEADLGSRLTVEEMFNKLQTTDQATQDTTGESQGSGEETTSFETLTKQVETSIDSKFNEFRSKLEQDRNEELVSNTLKQRFGDEASSKLEAKARELGRSMQEVQTLARQDPKLFLSMFPEKPSGSGQMTQTGSVSTEHANFSSSKSTRNHAYWTKLRRENPRDYYTPKMQNLLQSDAVEQGDEFYK